MCGKGASYDLQRGHSAFVTIDLDGVLIQNPFATGVFPEVRGLLAPALTAQGYDEETAGEQVMRRVRDGHRRRLAAGDWVGAYDWDAIVNEAAAGMGYGQTIDVAALVRRYCKPGYIAVYDDVERGLKYLRERFAAVYWLSNGFHKYQQPVVEALDIAGYFDGAFAPDTHGSAKPSPGLFHAAAKAARSTPELGLHIGDTLTHDVAGARRSGVPVVWLDRQLASEWQGCAPAGGEAEAHALEAEEGERLAAFAQVVMAKVQNEESPQAYGLHLPHDCLPDVAIATLDQLPQALETLARGGRLQPGA